MAPYELSGVSTRPMTKRDLTVASEIITSSLLAGGQEAYRPNELSELVASFNPPGVKARMADAQYSLAEIAGQPVAVTGWSDLGAAHFKLDSLFVDPKYQGRGLGKSLLSLTLGEMKRQSRNPAAMVHTTATLNAVDFYQAAGFAPEREVTLGEYNGVFVPFRPMSGVLHLVKPS
jgi:putative acetyltransferase